MKKINKLSILIPAYNEEKTILAILEKIKSIELINQITKEIILVDDFSKDSTVSIAENFSKENKDLQISIYRHEKNRGKGAAIHTAIEYASGEIIIIQDADLEYDPNEYNDLLRPIYNDYADVVYGSRFVGGKPHRILFFWHSIGNKILTLFSNAFTNLNLTDMETCYKMFKREVIQGIELNEKRFGFEPEVTAKIAKIPSIRIYEIGISYYGRTFDEGKKIGWKDGFRALYCILKYR